LKLLLVEDDAMLGPALKKGLEFNHYAVELAEDIETAREALAYAPFDLAVFDVTLPDGSGIQLLKEARRAPKTRDMPVVMLTAMSASEQKIAGLDAGADDYIAKPFDLGELLARLRAVMRRRQGRPDNIMRTSCMALDASAATLHKDGAEIRLSAHEFRFLALLMGSPGHIFSKSRIEEELYGAEGGAESNTVEALVYALRKKLGKDAVMTLRGMGYMVAP